MTGQRDRSTENSQKRFLCNPKYPDVLISGELCKAAEQLSLRSGKPVEEVIADALKHFLAKLGGTSH